MNRGNYTTLINYSYKYNCMYPYYIIKNKIVCISYYNYKYNCKDLYYYTISIITFSLSS